MGCFIILCLDFYANYFYCEYFHGYFQGGRSVRCLDPNGGWKQGARLRVSIRYMRPWPPWGFWSLGLNVAMYDLVSTISNVFSNIMLTDSINE